MGARRFQLGAGVPMALAVVALAGGASYLASRSPEQRLADRYAQELRSPASAGPPTSDLVGPKTRRYRARPGRPASFRIGFSDGGFWVEDARSDGAGLVNVIEHALRRGATAGAIGGDMFVDGYADGDAFPVTVAFRRHQPALVRRGWRGVTDMDLDVPSGRLLMGSNGDVQVAIDLRLPPGSYRARVSSAGPTTGWAGRERFRMDLWPRSRRAPAAVVKPIRA